jgi:hypothetical protein
MGLFLFRVCRVGEIRTLSGKNLIMGIYRELEARVTQPDGQEQWERSRRQEIGGGHM